MDSCPYTAPDPVNTDPDSTKLSLKMIGFHLTFDLIKTAKSFNIGVRELAAMQPLRWGMTSI